MSLPLVSGKKFNELINDSLVMEYANGGDLSQKIKSMQENDQMFQEEVIFKILTQMALGIKALHSLRIMHRDLKVSR